MSIQSAKSATSIATIMINKAEEEDWAISLYVNDFYTS